MSNKTGWTVTWVDMLSQTFQEQYTICIGTYTTKGRTVTK